MNMMIWLFLKELIRELNRDDGKIISQWDRDNFTYRCKSKFRDFAEFVALHYTLSHKDDTEYWRHIQNKNWLVEGNRSMVALANAKMLQHSFLPLGGGIHAIASGMHCSPTELTEEMWFFLKDKEQLIKEWTPYIENLNKRKNKWEREAKKAEDTYDFLKRYIY